MFYRMLADFVVVVHLLFIVLVVFGGLLACKRWWAVWVHIPTALYGALISFFGWICPLTPLENSLRRRAGSGGYENSFIETYLLPLIYPGQLTFRIRLVLGGAVIMLNTIIYAVLWHRWRRSR